MKTGIAHRLSWKYLGFAACAIMGTGGIIVLSRIQLSRLDGRSNYWDRLISFGGNNEVLGWVFGLAIFLSAGLYLRHQARKL